MITAGAGQRDDNDDNDRTTMMTTMAGQQQQQQQQPQGQDGRTTTTTTTGWTRDEKNIAQHLPPSLRASARMGIAGANGDDGRGCDYD